MPHADAAWYTCLAGMQLAGYELAALPLTLGSSSSEACARACGEVPACSFFTVTVTTTTGINDAGLNTTSTTVCSLRALPMSLSVAGGLNGSLYTISGRGVSAAQQAAQSRQGGYFTASYGSYLQYSPGRCGLWTMPLWTMDHVKLIPIQYTYTLLC